MTLTPKEIAEKNPLLYQTLVDEGVMPDTERIFYGGINMPQYITQPYFKKKKKDGEEYYVEPTAFDTPSVPFNTNFNRVGDTSIDAPPTTSQQFTPQQTTPANAGAIDAALGKMMDRHDEALRKLEASQLNPNDKKSIDARSKLAIAQEKERRPLVNALFLEPTAQATGISKEKLNNLSDKGYDLGKINDVLVYNNGKDIIKDFSDNKIANHITTPINSKIKLDKLMDLKQNLLWRYLTNQSKPVTEKNISAGMQQNIYSQLQQLIKNPNHPAVNENDKVVYNVTDQLSDDEKRAYGWKPGNQILQVSAYGVKPGKDVYQAGVFSGNKLDSLFGRVLVVTGSEDYFNDGSGETEIISVHDDFDFNYGFNINRSYQGGDVPGASYNPNQRVKGPEQPLGKGRGEFAGATDYVSTMATRVGRSIVNTASWANIGFPVPINIKFDDNVKRNNWRYEDDFPSPNYNESKKLRGITLYEKVKKRAFNPKDIKPEFPKDPPPKLDPETGMHPQYGQQVARYKKLDQHSADAMPETGDPEIDAEVFKQKSPKAKKRFKDFQRNLRA